MFCPSCKDEFRPGFTHCGRCNVDLVEELSKAEPGVAEVPESMEPLPVRYVDYCGFFGLEDARGARDELRRSRIHSEIAIREVPGLSWDQPMQEEYWLRIDSTKAKQAMTLLEENAAPVETRPEQPSTFNCSNCGGKVASEESFCPGCGARFDD